MGLNVMRPNRGPHPLAVILVLFVIFGLLLLSLSVAPQPVPLAPSSLLSLAFG
jgi:hypothetical protein